MYRDYPHGNISQIDWDNTSSVSSRLLTMISSGTTGRAKRSEMGAEYNPAF
jgi:hypothetical protein